MNQEREQTAEEILEKIRLIKARLYELGQQQERRREEGRESNRQRDEQEDLLRCERRKLEAVTDSMTGYTTVTR